MPELRKDPVTGRWVIIATDRAKRPTDFVRDKVQIRGSGFCPFCSGNESKTQRRHCAACQLSQPIPEIDSACRLSSNRRSAT